MADPRPLTRSELAQFLPNQRAIRAFEKLFDLIPSDLNTVLEIAEAAMLNASSLRTANNKLQQQIFELELRLANVNRNDMTQRIEELSNLELSASRNTVGDLAKRIENIEHQIAMMNAQNLSQILQRLDILESLGG